MLKIDIQWQICIDGYELSRAQNSETMDMIRPCSDKMKNVNPIDIRSALLKQLSSIHTKRGFIKFANHNGLLNDPIAPEPISEWYLVSKRMRDAIDFYDRHDYQSLRNIFKNESFHEAQTDINFNSDPPELMVQITSLKKCIWWQFINSITANQSFEKCAYCSTWFSVGHGTGRRKRQLRKKHSFCSPKHQGIFSYNRSKMREK